MPSYEKREPIQIEVQGLNLFGVLHIPKLPNPTPFPAILICHGLAGNKCGKTRFYVELSQKLAKVGIASLRIDFQGCGDSEGELVDTSLEDQVQDAVAGLNFLSRHPEIDASKLGIFGRSFGGAIAILAAAQFQNIQSIVLWAPVYNGFQWSEQWKTAQCKPFTPAQTRQLMTFNGQVVGKALLHQLFSLNLDDSLRLLASKPLLHIHSEKDDIVLIHHALKYEKMRENVAKTKFIRLAESDHSFSNYEEKELSLCATLEWFQSTLMPSTQKTVV